MSRDDVKPLNYCRDAIRDLMELERNLAFSAPFSAYAIRNVVQMLKDSVKFILPNCADFIAPEDLRQTHLDLARLPYPLAQDPLKPITASTKRIALCWELSEEFELVPGCNRPAFLNLPEGGVFICSIYWLDNEKRWTLSFGGAFYPYDNTLGSAKRMDDVPEGSLLAMASMIRAGRARKTSNRFACEPFVVLKEIADTALAQLGSREALDAGMMLNNFDEVSAFINACSILNCANVMVDSLPAGTTNQKKFVRGRRVAIADKKDKPAYTYKVLQITEERTRSSHTENRPGGGGGTKKMHLRRGHIRRLEERTVWVRPALINSDSGYGFADKDYKLTKKKPH